MAALARGSDAALEALVRAWDAPVHRFIYRYVQNAATARDLTQETFVRVYQHRSRYQPDTPFACWVFTIAANLCRNHRRWKWRHRAEPLTEEHGARASPHAGEVSEPPDQLAATEISQAVRAAIEALPPDLRCTVLLFEFDELSYRDIAAVVGCSERGVETRLARARVRLRERLGSLWHEILTETRTR
jgi:RNA polymerase sigma-70 factor, ECF subfamily